MSRLARIEKILKDHFAPTLLVVRDVSHTHAGHAGARPEGQTHYELEIEAAAFGPLSKVARHQAIYALLAAEFATGLHALAIKADAPKA